MNRDQRIRRKKRIRGKVSGTAARPRLTVFRSAKHMYAQVVDDDAGRVLASFSTVAKDARASAGEGSKTDAAKVVGKGIADACKGQGIAKVVFDRNGYIYHGRVRALADAAREAGLEL